MNIIVALKEFLINLSKKPLQKMTVTEALHRYLTIFQERKAEVDAQRHTITHIFPLQQKEFEMRLAKAGTDLHLQKMLALVVSMKQNGMFWTEGARIAEECEKSIQNIQEFIDNHKEVLGSNHSVAIQDHETYQIHFADIQKSDRLTQKHLGYLQSDGEFIKKDLIARAKERLESNNYQGLSFEAFFQKKKDWIRAEIPEIDLSLS